MRFSTTSVDSTLIARGIDHAAQDGFITLDEEEQLRTFRNHLALENDNSDPLLPHQKMLPKF